MLLNLFKYVLILWSMNVFLLTYFGRRFHPKSVTVSEKANFVTYCSGFLFLARSFIIFLLQIWETEKYLNLTISCLQGRLLSLRSLIEYCLCQLQED